MILKKIIAVGAAIAMLSVAAFADEVLGTDATNPLSSGTNLLSVEAPNFYIATGSSVIIPASEFVANGGGYLGDDNNLIGADELCDDYFIVSRRIYTKGAGLVSGISFSTYTPVEDGEALPCVSISFNSDTGLTNVNSPNFAVKEIRVKARANSDIEEENGFQRNAEYTYTGSTSNALLVSTAIVEKNEDDKELDLGIVNVVDTGTYGFSQFNVVDTTGDIFMTGRVYDGEEIYPTSAASYDLAVFQANPTVEDIKFYQVGLEGAAANWRIELYAHEDEYVYEVQNGLLVETLLEWDSEYYCFAGIIRGTVDFIVSDEPLVSPPIVEETE